MRTNIYLAALALVSAACGGPLLGAQAKDSQVCITIPDVTAPGGAGSITFTPSQALKIGDGIPFLKDKPAAINGSVVLGSFGFVTRDNTDLTQVQQVVIEAWQGVPGDAGSTKIQTITSQGASRAHPNELQFSVTPPQNLIDTLKATKGDIYLRVSFTGTVTPAAGATWTTDVTSCISADVEVDFTKI